MKVVVCFMKMQSDLPGFTSGLGDHVQVVGRWYRNDNGWLIRANLLMVNEVLSLFPQVTMVFSQIGENFVTVHPPLIQGFDKVVNCPDLFDNQPGINRLILCK